MLTPDDDGNVFTHDVIQADGTLPVRRDRRIGSLDLHSTAQVSKNRIHDKGCASVHAAAPGTILALR